MKTPKDQKGYDVLDGKALMKECEQEYQERDMKVRGYPIYGMPGDPEKDDNLGGFLPRNNVRERM